jgi:hypothetical protein
MDEPERQVDREVEDLDVPSPDAEDLKGGALNAYVPQVQGEKQGSAPSPAGNYTIQNAWPKKYSG